MFSLARQFAAVMAAVSCASHPLLPDAFVLHAHDGHHAHVHAIDLDAAAPRSSPSPGEHSAVRLPVIVGDEPEGSLIVVPKSDRFFARQGKRTAVPSAPAVSPSVAVGRCGVDTLRQRRWARPPPTPPPRAQCPLDAVLLTSNALLI